MAQKIANATLRMAILKNQLASLNPNYNDTEAIEYLTSHHGNLTDEEIL